MFLANEGLHDVQMIPLAQVSQFGIEVHEMHLSASEAFLNKKYRQKCLRNNLHYNWHRWVHHRIRRSLES
jgi:hypothetical protein